MTHDGRRPTEEGRQTTPRVWHKLPTGELKTLHPTLFYNYADSNLKRTRIMYSIATKP